MTVNNLITFMVYKTLCDNKEMYSYEIYKELSEILRRYNSSISQNSVYSSLYSGENKGHLRSRVEMIGKKKRVYYKINNKGKEYCQKLEKDYAIVKDLLTEFLEKKKNTEKFVLPTDRMPRGDEIDHIIRIIKNEEEYDGDMDELLRVGLELGSM